MKDILLKLMKDKKAMKSINKARQELKAGIYADYPIQPQTITLSSAYLMRTCTKLFEERDKAKEGEMFNLKGCPHCGKDSTIRRIQSTDELNWTLVDEDSKELWQCEECTGYFIIEYKAVKITRLEPKI